MGSVYEDERENSANHRRAERASMLLEVRSTLGVVASNHVHPLANTGMATDSLNVQPSVCETDQIESKMTEDERSDPIFFPEHLHVLREKLDSNRKHSSGRSVGALPGKSRRSDQRAEQGARRKLCKPSSHNASGFRLTCNTGFCAARSTSRAAKGPGHQASANGAKQWCNDGTGVSAERDLWVALCVRGDCRT